MAVPDLRKRTLLDFQDSEGKGREGTPRPLRTNLPENDEVMEHYEQLIPRISDEITWVNWSPNVTEERMWKVT